MADDGYSRYYTEKLWELLPEVYRHEDGLADPPGVLRALLEIVGDQAAVLRRSIDRLWEDQSIEACDDWAVPYIGDLLATRMVSALERRGRRVDVAKTISYRRRKGTVGVLEELTGDITGWDGTVSEGFLRLARRPHRLDQPPVERIVGGRSRAAATPLGGNADLRDARVAEGAGGAFDEFAYTPDVRRPRGRDGLLGIKRVALHVYRLPSVRVAGIEPHPVADGAYTFDPSGRDVALFAPRGRTAQAPRPGGDPNGWTAARPWELPAPISCRLLGHAEYRITTAARQQLALDAGWSNAQLDALLPLLGQHFAGEAALRRALHDSPSVLAPTRFRELLGAAIVADCGKAALWPAAVSVEVDGAEPAPGRVAAGELASWSDAVPDGIDVVVDPERGRFRVVAGSPAAVAAMAHVGGAGHLGAGGQPRVLDERPVDVERSGGGALTAAELDNSGVTEILDSATYGPVANKLSVDDLQLRAADRQRPYLRLDGDWVLSTGARQGSSLLLDGVWLGAGAPVALVLRGEYADVTLRACTLDPGGPATAEPGSPVLPAVELRIEGLVDRLRIEQCVLGAVRTAGDGAVERLEVRDSVLQSLDEAVPAMVLSSGQAHLDRVTVLGDVDVHRLWASEALIAGDAQVTDTGQGCFRFGAAADGSRLPRPYESHLLADDRAAFASRRFGDADYARLSAAAPRELRHGAENGSEIGAFAGALWPVKQRSLQRKADEYLPFGLVASIVHET